MRVYQGGARINASVNAHARFYDYIDALTSELIVYLDVINNLDLEVNTVLI
jgi:hypothetical protein